LRFAEVDNLSAFNLGVDNVFIFAVVVPEPASWRFLGTVAPLFLIVAWFRLKKK
jgi:hypothetical protein